MSNQPDSSQIRQQFRQLRNSLTPTQQQNASHAIIEPVLQLITQLNAKKIALYLAFDGELETMPLIEKLWQLNYQVFLPVIQKHKRMIFMPFTPDTPIKLNQYKIREPIFNELITANDACENNFSEKTQKSVAVNVDLILTPLVAFDDENNRIGMGGGFYDRVLHNWQQQNFKPVGICHKIQKATKIVPNKWDVALFKIIAV